MIGFKTIFLVVFFLFLYNILPLLIHQRIRLDIKLFQFHLKRTEANKNAYKLILRLAYSMVAMYREELQVFFNIRVMKKKKNSSFTNLQ